MKKLFVGSYTNTGSFGIYVFDFNENTGKAKLLDSVKTDNPSYLAINKNGDRIYAINENGGENPGAISCFSFNKKTNHLALINTEATGGDHPCFVAVSKNGETVLAANYTGGSISVFKTKKDGSLNPVEQVIQHVGTGPNSTRQEKAHVHQTIFSPDEKNVFVNDLGNDETTIYPYHPSAKNILDTKHAITVKANAGAGPRHLAFHPNGKYFYVVEELKGTLAAYKLGEKTPSFLQRIKLDNISADADLGSADIHISPDGKFLYASNRGTANNITICQIDTATGKLKTIGYEKTGGNKPRNFVIDPSGKYLLAANQATDNIVVFKRNAVTGLLQKTGIELNIKAPTCLIF